jgi:hypothetical protein
MWADKTYTLFTYERLRDVRIVYVPPMSLGCFGGDTDVSARNGFEQMPQLGPASPPHPHRDSNACPTCAVD